MEQALQAAQRRLEGKAPPPPVPVPGRPLEAKTLAETLAREKAKTWDLSASELYQRGVTAMRQGRYEDAAAHFQQVLALQPDHAQARQGLERAKAALEKSAKKAASAATKGKVPSAKVTAPVAPTKEEEARKEEDEIARQIAKEKADLLAKRILELYQQALLALQLGEGNYEEAIRFFQDILALDPNHKEARQGLELAKAALAKAKAIKPVSKKKL